LTSLVANAPAKIRQYNQQILLIRQQTLPQLNATIANLTVRLSRLPSLLPPSLACPCALRCIRCPGVLCAMTDTPAEAHKCSFWPQAAIPVTNSQANALWAKVVTAQNRVIVADNKAAAAEEAWSQVSPLLGHRPEVNAHPISLLYRCIS